MIKLDGRLSEIAKLVRLDKRICDVGTDHALLPCYLCENGATDVTASDINLNPLDYARDNIDKYGFTGRIKLVQSDGLKNIPPCDDIIIAGMGGELIAEIIGGCTFVTEDTRFILQPMTKAEYLRRWLYSSGYEIMLENGAESAGKPYTVMLVRYTGEKRMIDDEFAFFGKCTDERYIKKVCIQLTKLSRKDPSLAPLIRKDLL